MLKFDITQKKCEKLFVHLTYLYHFQDNYQKQLEAENKKRPRKKSKPPALTRPPRKGKKKKKGRYARQQLNLPPAEPIALDSSKAELHFIISLNPHFCMTLFWVLFPSKCNLINSLFCSSQKYLLKMNICIFEDSVFLLVMKIWHFFVK